MKLGRGGWKARRGEGRCVVGGGDGRRAALFFRDRLPLKTQLLPMYQRRRARAAEGERSSQAPAGSATVP